MKKELQINQGDNKKYVRWNQIRNTLIRAYGKDINEAKSEASNKLFAISMKENETFEDYNMRFKHYQAESGVIEESTVVHLYKKGLANHLQEAINEKIVLCDDGKLDKLDNLMKIANKLSMLKKYQKKSIYQASKSTNSIPLKTKFFCENRKYFKTHNTKDCFVEKKELEK
ncbi:hypothetical protein INT47_008829 [Mucor saturninus]|uniref:Retrotransposon gag domain-containing protein n=1 Tax=Mucor saturninus TaxID=64648 RepID=A0A8H7VAM5_9FUNG|nr:hypothetical protein INT47_008829 [Mucor saturninus]